MPRRFNFLLIALYCVSTAALSFPLSSKAGTLPEPRHADTAYDLINGVNALRAAYGLAPYTINSILMYTSQAQADFMAANGTVTHSGPGGIGVTDRLLAAGYPLAGDLSLGGFRSENIIGGLESMPAQTAIDQWTGDAPHLTTMVSPDLTEIGAGVSVLGGRVYYVIDCARPTTARVPQTSITPVGGGSPVPAIEAPVRPIQTVVVSTPNPEGNIIHEVKYGQTLWQIAITYETRIDEIKRLNNLSSNDIYPGEKLLIKTGVSVPTLVPTVTATSEIISTSTLEIIAPTGTFQPTATMTLHPSPVVVSQGNKSTTISIVIGIVVLALLGGIWMGTKKSDDN